MDNRFIWNSRFILLLVCASLFPFLVGCGREQQQSEIALSGLFSVAEVTKFELPISELDTDNEKGTQLAYNAELLKYFTPTEHYEMTDYLEYHGEKYVYYIFQYKIEEEETFAMEFHIVVLNDNKYLTTLSVTDEERGGPYAEIYNLILEIDVNFNGKKDTLLWLGHFGNQGLLRYKCYLSTDTNLELFPSFSDIANPSIINETETIGSNWRNSATSHGWAYYKYIDDELVEVDRLTEFLDYMEDETKRWNWRMETNKNGEMVIMDEFNDQECSSEEIDAKIYGEDSFWELGNSDNWRDILCYE